MPVSEKNGLTRRQIKFLHNLFPNKQSLFYPEETLIYGTDASKLFAFPWAVVRPNTKQQVQELLSWAQKEEIPIFPRARGTNVVGDCVPLGGGVVISSLFLNKILEVDHTDFVAIVEPGVVTATLQKALRKQRLFYPPDPASVKISTIGGNVATNAGGLSAVKYGVTSDYVLGTETVLSGGRLINTGGRFHKDVAGLNLTKLLVGSEGTLGFFTKIILKLLPLPESSISVLAGFSSLENALEVAQNVFMAGITPVALELMDDMVIQCLSKTTSVSWPQGTNALLLFKLDGAVKSTEAELARLEKVLAQLGPLFLNRGLTESEQEKLWNFRRMINPAAFQLAKNKLSVDVTVPRGKVGEGIQKIKYIGSKFGLPILTFGHLGDGNIHVNIMYDATNKQENKYANEAIQEVLLKVLQLKGTISGEHGVGLTKLPFIRRQFNEEELRIMKDIKKAFDPNFIMNPGKGY